MSGEERHVDYMVTSSLDEIKKFKLKSKDEAGLDLGSDMAKKLRRRPRRLTHASRITPDG